MENVNEINSNSSVEIKNETQNSSSSEVIPTFKKKEFIFTEKRKENLVKANKARKEKESYKQELREKYETATQELQKLYESKINNFSCSSTKPIENTDMSAIKIEKIPIEPVKPILKEEVKEIKNSSEGSSSSENKQNSEDSDSSVEIRKKKRVKTKEVKKKKKIVYIDESSDSDEVIIQRKRVKHGKPSKQYESEDSEAENDHVARHPPPMARYAAMARPQIGANKDRRGAISGCIF